MLYSLAELLLEHIRLNYSMTWWELKKLALKYFTTCPPSDDAIKATLYYLSKNKLICQRGFTWCAVNPLDELK